MHRVKDYYFDVLESAEKMKYLNGLSYETRFMIAQRLSNNQTNLYHSVMSVINYLIKNTDDLKSFDVNNSKEKYFNQFKQKHNFKEEDRQNIYELFEFCFQKYSKK